MTLSAPRAVIVLIGYRGTGKTTVARELALALAWDWVDCDVEVELAAGCSIAEIFAQSGEAAFRDAESAVLQQLLTRERTIIAAGGGAVLRAENRAALRSAGLVVWLTAEVGTIVERIAADATTAARRPNLLGGGEAEIRQLLAERTPLYRECATFAVVTDGRTASEIAGEIMARSQPGPTHQEGN